MKLLLIITTIFSLTYTSISQTIVEPDEMKRLNIVVNVEEFTIKAQVLKDGKKIKPELDLTYHWYASQKIMETKGGFDGKVLDGSYRCFYTTTNQLKEQGTFTYGVKSGEWKNWYTDGKLREVSTWKQGRKNGAYVLYNEAGVVMAKSSFKNNLLHGNFYTYDTFGNVTMKKNYKQGKEVLESVDTPKESKLKKQQHEAPSEKAPKEKKPLFKKKAKKDKDSIPETSPTKTSHV